MCLWILGFLLNRSQVVEVGATYRHHVLCLLVRLGDVFCRQCYTLCLHKIVYLVMKIPKYWNVLVIELITNADESEYRDQVNKLISWCSENNLELSVNKTKLMIVDFRKKNLLPSRLFWSMAAQLKSSNISSFLVLQSVIILNIDTIVKKAALLSKKVEIIWFDHTYHVHLLQSCNCVFWHFQSQYGLDYHSEGKAQIEQSCKNFSRIIGRDLPRLESLYHQRLLGRTILIPHDSSHPAHDLFDPLTSSRQFRSFKTRTNRFSSTTPPP